MPVTAVPGKRQIVGDGWSLRAESVGRAKRSDGLAGHEWRALIGVRRGLKLLVTWPEATDTAEKVGIAAWAGQPDETDGVAVIDAGGGDLRLARVPLCSCGDRGCGNAGKQLDTWLAAGRLPGLVELLRGLPWTNTVPSLSNVTQLDDGPPSLLP